ncbi:MAG TPA: MarR family transcriptional regulator [Rhodoglobus sp.]|nr:MarR family transcriptional regulator [Rhodoglobus sp.]
MTDDLDDELRIAIMRLARRMRLERADEDVTDGQLSVLFVLTKHGAQTLGALSEHERVTPPSMNRTVNALENNGLIVRESSPDDGRKVLITLTDRARALVAETQRRRVAWFSRQLASLSAAERGALDTAAPILRTLADS